jgi:quercetin dioxygenase-like cupin family protein
MNSADNKGAMFQKGERAPLEYFTGNAWVKTLVANEAGLNCTSASVMFEAGARNFWHTHPGGQILIVIDGKGYYQEKDSPSRIIQKGDVITIPQGLEHWHGASHDSEMTHLAINPNTQKGVVNWLRKVTDEEYDQAKSSSGA